MYCFGCSANRFYLLLMKKRGLLISGGGTKISGHAGFISAFERMDIKFDSVAGVSAGAIIAPFAAGGKVLENSDLFKSITPNLFWKKNPFSKRGGLSGFALWQILRKKDHLGDFSNLKKTLKEHFPIEEYIRLKKEGKGIYAESVDFDTGSVILDSNWMHTYRKFIDAIVDSASIPLFSDVTSGADGGLRNHLPIKSLEKMGGMEELFCLYSRPEDLSGILEPYNPRSILDPIQRAFSILMYEISKNDQENIRRWALKEGVILREFYMPKIMNGFYDTDLERQKKLFEACERIAFDRFHWG